MSDESNIWTTTAVVVGAYVLGVLVALTISVFNVNRTVQASFEEGRGKAVSFEQMNASIERIEDGMNAAMIGVLQAHVLVLERSLQQCNALDTELEPGPGRR
jgi:mannose/fructose/N-acetylgalactosamine-specific phosphotransferase system component IID